MRRLESQDLGWAEVVAGVVVVVARKMPRASSYSAPPFCSLAIFRRAVRKIKEHAWVLESYTDGLLDFPASRRISLIVVQISFSRACRGTLYQKFFDAVLSLLLEKPEA